MFKFKIIITIVIITLFNCFEKDKNQETSLTDFFIKNQGSYRYTYIYVDKISGCDSIIEKIRVTYEPNGIRKIASEHEVKLNEILIHRSDTIFCFPKIKNKVFAKIDGTWPVIEGEIIANNKIKLSSLALSFSIGSTSKTKKLIKGKVLNVFRKKAFGKERKTCNLQFKQANIITNIQLMEEIGRTNFLIETENNDKNDTLWNIKLTSIDETI